ncbi:hypothetical protein COE15_19030 [Bacillus cereus]|uniref:hypothetical protein n=1 Tax=Bacillus TaxID=1386 RepID=UPI000BF2FDDD|nr:MULTISPECIES: hypothetical protein [Bacillus]PFD96756.1 hypothetical protein CN288_23610 [Bacillus sp. AFS023182]PGX96830.1 hypothetical protein COE15_19030 [Bacillus cereus]WIY62892.1 hypothetical protein QRY57_10590 [Bacillus arachidis]
MGNLKKKNIIILIILAIITLTIGCTAKFIHDRNTAKEKATKVVIQYMKKENNIELVVTNVKIEHLEREGFITVGGYDKNNKQKRYYVVINKIQNYTVDYWGDAK